MNHFITMLFIYLSLLNISTFAKCVDIKKTYGTQWVQDFVEAPLKITKQFGQK